MLSKMQKHCAKAENEPDEECNGRMAKQVIWNIQSLLDVGQFQYIHISSITSCQLHPAILDKIIESVSQKCILVEDWCHFAS